jgi:hypothetical protein
VGRRGDGAGDERTAERATSGQSPSQIFFFFFFLRGNAHCFDRITRAPLIARQSCDSHQSAVCRSLVGVLWKLVPKAKSQKAWVIDPMFKSGEKKVIKSGKSSARVTKPVHLAYHA